MAKTNKKTRTHERDKIATISRLKAENAEILKYNIELTTARDENADCRLALIALADVFGIPPGDNQFDEAFKAAAKLKAEVDGGILKYDTPQPVDPAAVIDVLYITTDYGRKYTCRTVVELGIFIVNFKKERPNVGFSMSHGKMTEAEWSKIPLDKYFVKQVDEEIPK